MTEKDVSELPKPKSFPFSQFLGVIMVLVKSTNLFEKYSIDKYMSALGLSIATKYRGLGISTHILKARYG